MRNFIKSVSFRVLAFIMAALVGIMLYSASVDGVASVPAAITGVVLTPIQSAASWFAGGWRNVVGAITDGGTLRQEKNALQEEMNTLRQQQAELDDLRRQNEMLQQYLGLKEQNPDWKLVSARVVATDPTAAYRLFSINAGTLQGISKDDAVITSEGLVGVVLEAGPNYSKVRTILDSRLKVTAYVSRSHAHGSTVGTSTLALEGQLLMERLDRSDSVAAGDIILTLGEGSRYPPGLMIGAVQEVVAASDGLTMNAVIKPYADLRRLSDVMVITDFAGKNELSGGEETP